MSDARTNSTISLAAQAHDRGEEGTLTPLAAGRQGSQNPPKPWQSTGTRAGELLQQEWLFSWPFCWLLESGNGRRCTGSETMQL